MPDGHPGAEPQEPNRPQRRPRGVTKRDGLPGHLMILLVVVGAAVVLLLVPVTASYINAVGADTVEYRRASCGPPALVWLGHKAGLGGGSPFPLGKVNATSACGAAAGKRTAVALALVLASLSGAGARRHNARREQATQANKKTPCVP
jgi:hypothetical protein